MAEATFSLDLHVLGPPLTFALSQDQTLHRKFEPARRRLVVPVPGGKGTSTWNGFLRTKITYSTTTCYPVFRDRTRNFLPDHCQVIEFLRFFLSSAFAFEGCCFYSVRSAVSTVSFELFSVNLATLPVPSGTLSGPCQMIVFLRDFPLCFRVEGCAFYCLEFAVSTVSFDLFFVNRRLLFNPSGWTRMAGAR